MCLISILNMNTFYQIKINMSDSLPGKLYLVMNEQAECGDYLTFYIDQNPFFKNGFLTKIAKGCEGDIIKYKNGDFYINDVYIGKAKNKSRKGKAVQHTVQGIIPKDYYFAWSQHVDSYDSRYQSLGLIHKSRTKRTYKIF